MNGYLETYSDPYAYHPYSSDVDIKKYLIEYSQKVIDGTYYSKTCKKHKWACERFLKDIEYEGTDEFPFIFNNDKAKRHLNWQKIFKHIKGPLKGQRINPHDIQVFVLGNLYGWEHRDSHYRRFRKVYWQEARKNAKTQTCVGVASDEMTNVTGDIAEVYIGATKKEQSKILWDDADAMINGSELASKFEVAYQTIKHKKSGSFIKSLSKDSGKTGDGTNPQCAIIEEYHAHPTDEILEINESGMGAREQPLIFIITTPWFF